LTEPNVWLLKRVPSHLKTATLSKASKSSKSQMVPYSKLFLSNSSSSNMSKRRKRTATLNLPTMTMIRVSHTSPPITSRNLHRSISLSQTTSLVFLSNKSRRKLSVGLNLTKKVLTTMSVLTTNNSLWMVKITLKKVILMEMLESLISPMVTM